MTFCAVCAKNVEPVAALHKVYGVCSQCPECETPFGQVQGGGYLTRPEGDKQDPVPALPAAQSVAVPALPRSVSPATTDNITAMMRARLAEVEKEIAARIGFETERDRLKRMLAAAGDAEEPPAIRLAN